MKEPQPRSHDSHGSVAVGRWCLIAVCAAWMMGGMVATKGDDATSSREELETDRDSFTFAPTTAGAATSILESSYSFIDNRLGPETHSVPEVLVRRGIGEKVEARLGFNYEAGGSGTVFPTGS